MENMTTIELKDFAYKMISDFKIWQHEQHFDYREGCELCDQEYTQRREDDN